MRLSKLNLKIGCLHDGVIFDYHYQGAFLRVLQVLRFFLPPQKINISKLQFGFSGRRNTMWKCHC
jgi:hypothetical protein